MANNDEVGGSGGKQFWELSQEMEEQSHRHEDTAQYTDPDYTTPSGVGDDTTDGAAEDATTDDGGAHTDGGGAHTDGSNRRSKGRTGARMRSAPSRRNLLKWTPTGIQRSPNI